MVGAVFQVIQVGWKRPTPLKFSFHCILYYHVTYNILPCNNNMSFNHQHMNVVVGVLTEV